MPNGYTNPGCASTLTSEDVWYSFTTAGSGPGSTGAVVTVSNVPAARQVRLFAAASCAGPLAELACADTPAHLLGAAPLVATGLVPNTTYYVSVASQLGQSGQRLSPYPGFFTICVSALPPALPCLAPSRVDTLLLGGGTVNVNSWLVPGSAPPLSYTVTYAAAGSPPVVVTAPYSQHGNIAINQLYSPTTLSGLLPGVTYTATVVANCAGGGQSAPVGTSFTVPALPAPPANDFCTNAQRLPLNTRCVATLATNLNATSGDPVATLIPRDCTGFSEPDDVWFTVVVPASGIVAVTTGTVSGSVVQGTGLTLYAGTCAQLTRLGCQIGASAQVRRTGLVPGSTLYARVWRTGGSTNVGPFSICATTDSACAVATGLAVAGLTPTSATLTFALPTAGGRDTLIYTASGGLPQARLVSSSPAVLTGLLPGTTYTVALRSTCTSGVPAQVSTTFRTPANTCAPPLVVYVSNVSATGAGVGFRLNPAAGSYTLSYQATGGPLLTLPAPASPVTLTGLAPGTSYTVCLASTCPNGLTSAPACAPAFTTPVLASRNAALAAQLGLFPNPAHHAATLTVPAALLRQPGLLTLSDALGRAVQQRYVTPVGASEARVELDLAGLPPGVYWLRLLSSAGPLVRRLVVE